MREGEVEERRRSGLMTLIIYNNISWGGNNSANSMRKAAIFWFVMLCAQNDAQLLVEDAAVCQSYIVCASDIEVIKRWREKVRNNSR